MQSATPLFVCLLIAASCATTRSHAPETRAAADDPAIEEAGEPEVARGCSVRIAGGGDPIRMDDRDPDVGVVPAEVAKRLDGTHVVQLASDSWWSAPGLEYWPLGTLTVELETLGTARKQADAIDLDAKLRMHHEGGLHSLEQQVTFVVYDSDSVYAHLEIDDPALAKRLGLPKAADPSKVADSFELILSLADRKLEVQLASTRAGNRCSLARSYEPPKAECEKRYGMLVMPETAVARQRPLRARLAPRFAPEDALAELARQQLEIQWPDGPPSRLHVDYEPSEAVCVTEGKVPVHTSWYDATVTLGYKVVMPLHAVLRSEDGRLAARFSGFAETYVGRDGTWDRFVVAQLDYTPVTRLGPYERPGFDVPDDVPALLYTWLRTPITDSEMPVLAMRVCQPFEGAPPYPDVVEDAPNRLGCFCASERGSQAAHIRSVR